MNLGVLWLCGSLVANLIIYRFVPSPFRFENKQCRTHFHMKGFALRLVLKQKHKRTRKWPIGLFITLNRIFRADKRLKSKLENVTNGKEIFAVACEPKKRTTSGGSLQFPNRFSRSLLFHLTFNRNFRNFCAKC